MNESETRCPVHNVFHPRGPNCIVKVIERESKPWDTWKLISLRKGLFVPCQHGRPDHIVMIHQLARSLGLELPALDMSPERVWNGLLDEVEHQRKRGNND